MDEITPNNEADTGSSGAASGKADTGAGTGASASAMTDNLIITRPRAPAAFDLQSEFKPLVDSSKHTQDGGCVAGVQYLPECVGGGAIYSQSIGRKCW